MELAVDVRGDFIGCLAAAQGTEKVQTPEQQCKLEQFMEVTEQRDPQASLYLLKGHGWDVQAAVTTALDDGGVGDVAPATAEHATEKPKPKGGAKRWISSSTRK